MSGNRNSAYAQKNTQLFGSASIVSLFENDYNEFCKVIIKQAMKNVIDYTISGGVHGLFILGSSGEIYGLNKN